MKMYSFKNRAFSTLEMILTVALISVSLGFVFIFSQSSQVRSDLQTQTSLLVSQLRLAQSNALSGNAAGPKGLHLTSNEYTLFREDSYDAQSSFNEVVQLPPSLSLTNISIAGSGSDIIFSSPKGETTNAGSFRVTSSAQNQYNQITISSIGTIN